MKLLKNEQYKIVNQYFQLNEKLDSALFKAFVSDLEKMDLEKQSDTIKQLQEFIYLKTREINTKKKANVEDFFYNKNKNIIEKIKEILKNSYLRKIDKIFNLRRFKNLKIQRKYKNIFNTFSNKNINSKIENNYYFYVDQVVFDWLNSERTLRIELKIDQFYDYTNEPSFNLYIHTFLPRSNGEIQPIYKKFERDYFLKLEIEQGKLEELNEKMKLFNDELDEFELLIDAEKYNL